MEATITQSRRASFLKNNYTLFAVIFLLHLALKSMNLASTGLWYGESFDLFYSGQDWGLIKHTAEWNRSAPLYYYFLAIWNNLFGNGEFAVRFSSVIFSSLTAALLFITVRRHFNFTAAIFSLVFFTLSGDIYYYAQEASSHSLVIFLVVTSFCLFLELIDRKKFLFMILLVLCNFFMVYGQYATIIIPVLELLLVLVFFRKEIFFRIGISFLASLVLLALRLTAKTYKCILEGYQKNTAPTLEDLKWMFYDFFNGQMLALIFSAICLVSLIYLVYSRKIKFSNRITNLKYTSVFTLGIGGMFACMICYFLMPETSKFYFLFVTPFLFMIPGLLISNTGNEIKFALIGITLFFSAAAYTRVNFKVSRTMDYRSIVRIVKYLKKPDTLVLVETRDVGHLFAYYFDQEAFGDFKGMEDKLKQKDVYLVTTVDDVKAIDLKKYKRVVLTQSFENLNPDNKELVKYIKSQHEFDSYYWAYHDVILNVYESRPAYLSR